MTSRTFRKTLSLLLAALLFVSLSSGVLSGRALAASSFKDVPSGSYYSKAVSEMSSAGLVTGYKDGTFRPANYVTSAEALALVCSVGGINCKGYTKVTAPWYTDVVTWSEVHGIAPTATVPGSAATREQICDYIAAAYKLDTSSAANAFPDTTSKSANALYANGIISGIPTSDGKVIFGGSQKVKRCDVCVMLMQLRDKAQKPDWSKETGYSLDLTHYTFSAPSTVTTFPQLVKLMGYAIIHSPCTVSFKLKPDSAVTDLSATLKNAFKYASRDYYEFYSTGTSRSLSYYVSSIPKGGSASITLSTTGYDYASGSLIDDDTTRRTNRDFYAVCCKDVASLYESGKLTSAMTAKEKADVLCYYVHQNVKYDYNFKNYSGYCAAVEGTAVCEGYTAFYNCLCNLAGVPMEAATDNKVLNHAWSWTYSDGTYYNVDATFCDQDDEWSYNDMHSHYFWVTNEQMKQADIETNGKARELDSDSIPYAFK